MEKKPEPDLTTTIHLGARQSPDTSDASNLTKFSEEERGIVAKLSPKDGMLIVHWGPGKGSRFLLTDTTMIGRSPESEIFLDDVRLEDKEMILPVQVSSVAYVKVFRGPFIAVVGGGNASGASLPGGVIAIYTKHSNSKIEDPDHKKAVENAVLNGYSVFKEFYNPNYENASDNFLPDNRTTLYWNPYVLTNTQNKKVNIEFYNNDTSKKLQIILEGVNSNGKLTRVVKYLE